MPLYEYQCEQCGRRTEKIQKFSDAELTVCPHCGGRLERTITAAAVQFSGGGWYKDLYSSSKPAATGASGAASPGETAGGSGGGSGESTGAGSASTPSADKAAAPSPAAAPASPAAAPASKS